MADRQPIELLEKTFGNSAWYEVIPTGNRKLICHKWRVTGTNCAPVLNAILPHIIVKKKQAALVMKLVARIFPRGGHFTAKTRIIEYRARTALYKKMRGINHTLPSITGSK
ncbi:hypothetical protein HYU96_00485 [Candidatus Daviesbacteria bacterium]|nr:hypothetical protein [Candidatus Daviesbacteria bacterium]